MYTRRQWVILDAHTTGLAGGDALLLDLHSAPLRLFVSADSPVAVDIRFPGGDAASSMCGLSRGGINPNGRNAEANLFLVEFDNRYSRGSRARNTNPCYVERLDQITWFSEQADEERNDILRHLR